MKRVKAMGWSLLLVMVLAGGGFILPRPANAHVQCKVSATPFTLMVYTNLYKDQTFPEFSPVNTPPEFTNSIPPKFYHQWSICQTGTAFYTDDYRVVQSDGGSSYANTAFSAGIGYRHDLRE